MAMMQRKENIVLIKSEAFSTRIVKMYKHLTTTTDERIMSKQILRSGTSVGANVSESVYAQSANDFISKLSIALKEAQETVYWLKCLNAGNYITDTQHQSMFNDLNEVISLLVKIIKTTKQHNNIRINSK